MDLILSVIKEVVLTFLKAAVTDAAKHIMIRLKERTAPTRNRDGSGNK